MPSSYNRATGAIDAFTTGTLTGVVSGSDHGNKADALNKIQAQVVKEAPLNVEWPEFGAAPSNTATQNSTAINAAITAADAAGGGIVLVSRDYSFNTLSFANKNNVRLVGQGIEAASLTTAVTTGNIFDFTTASFCSVEDLTFNASAQRTAGAVFYLDAGAGTCQRNEFRRLRISGGWRAWHLDDCGTTAIDEIQVGDLNASHGWHSVIHLAGGTISTTISNIRGGTEAAVTNAFVLVDGATVDTAQFRNFDILNFGASTGMACVTVGSGTWIKFTDCSFESGTTSDAFNVTGGKGIDLTACHLLGKRALTASGGTGVRMIGGEVVATNEHGILLTGGTHYEVIGVTISDVGRLTTNTYNGISASGVTDFTIANNHFGNMLLGSSENMVTGITTTGACDRYVITGNRVATTGVFIPIDDSGTGTDKVVKDNVWAGSGYGTVASAANININGTLSNAAAISVTGTTNITSMTAGGKGRRVTLVFAGVLTFTDGSNLKLAGNLVTTADDTITLVSDGTNWIETSRSVN